MANYLGAVLQGLESGVRTGLDMYKTVQSEARAKRVEQYTLARDAVEDKRYGEERTYRAQQDTLSQTNNERDFKFRERVQTHSEEQAAADEAAAERRHRETLALTQRRMAAADARTGAKIQLANRKEIKSQVEALVGDGSAEGFTRVINAVNTDMNVHAFAVDQARGAGFNIPDDMVGRLQVMPAGEGRVMFAVKGDDGKLQPYDPDGPGEDRAVVLDSAQFMAAMGGKGGVQASVNATELGATQGQATQQVLGDAANSRGGIEQRRQGTATSLADVDRQIAVLKKEQENLTQSLDTGEYTLAPEGTVSVVSDTSPRSGTEAASRAREAQGEIEALEQKRVGLSGQMDEIRGESRTLRQETPERKAQVDNALAGIAKLPAGEQAVAARNFRETAKEDLDLALRHPGKSLKEATEIERKTRDGLIDKVTGYMDTKTMLNPKGELVSLKAGKTDARAALLSMTPEIRAVVDDYTGRSEGALQRATQEAVNAGKPNAVPYFLYSYAAGVDGKALVDLMADESLKGPKFNDKVRFAYASRAVELMRDGKADDPEAALGMAIQEPAPKMPRIAKGSTLGDVMR